MAIHFLTQRKEAKRDIVLAEPVAGRGDRASISRTASARMSAMDARTIGSSSAKLSSIASLTSVNALSIWRLTLVIR
jgi:hypothetical protein